MEIVFLKNLKARIRRLVSTLYFNNSEDYWKKRYDCGGNSGSGSYGNLAEFKGQVISDFVKENRITSAIEFGSGDGNQLKYIKMPNYLGFDISETAIENCKNIFKEDQNLKFKLLKDFQGEKADLVLSIDVIFHLIEDRIYYEYMNRLFSSSLKFVIIYSSDSDLNHSKFAPHFKQRAFTKWVEKNFPAFSLIKKIPNQYPYDGTEQTSVSDFFIYEKRDSQDLGLKAV